jgi:hypothetical protein
MSTLGGNYTPTDEALKFVAMRRRICYTIL